MESFVRNPRDCGGFRNSPAVLAPVAASISDVDAANGRAMPLMTVMQKSLMFYTKTQYFYSRGIGIFTDISISIFTEFTKSSKK
jgi:hypothetical protein